MAAAAVLADDIAARRDDIQLRSRIAAGNPAVWAYERTMLEADLAETLAGFVADRLGVSAGPIPAPQCGLRSSCRRSASPSTCGSTRDRRASSARASSGLSVRPGRPPTR